MLTEYIHNFDVWASANPLAAKCLVIIVLVVVVDKILFSD
jgi:hypothetical protein